MAEATVTPSNAPLLFGRYRVSEQVGETRIAAVYAATDERLHRRVLLHLLRKELVGQERAQVRFVAEISQMARRSHQALLEVFDSGTVGDRPFMVTEYCAGRPLRGLGFLTVEQALLYIRQVTGAVAVCQAARASDASIGVYHPPISSSNVLLIDEGRVKLVDSWLLPPAEVPAELAHYRPPELSEGQTATPASAVYSLGLLLHELITGTRPVTGADARATALAHLTIRIPPLSQTRRTLFLPTAERLVARATARLPAHRFADAQALGEALDGLWRDLGAATQPLGGASARQGSGRQRPVTPPPVDETPARPQPAVPPRRRPSGLTDITGRLLSGRTGPQPVDPDLLRKQSFIRGLVGWLVLVGLIAAVAVGSYVAINALADRLAWGRPPAITAPGLPQLPTPPSEGPLSWLGSLFGGQEEIYIVNIAEGLNLRSEPDASTTTNVITVVANGTPVRKLEGPRVEGNIPWLRVSTEVDGQQVEGWMSLNYLRPNE